MDFIENLHSGKCEIITIEDDDDELKENSVNQPTDEINTPKHDKRERTVDGQTDLAQNLETDQAKESPRHTEEIKELESLQKELSKEKTEGLVDSNLNRTLFVKLEKGDEIERRIGELTTQNNPPKRFYKCKLCNSDFSNARLFTKHWETCKNSFPVLDNSKTLITLRVKTKNKSNGRLTVETLEGYVENLSLRCTGCTFKCQSGATLWKHSLECGGISKDFNYQEECPKQTLRCKLCPYKTLSPDRLINHSNKHSQDYPYKCDVCSYTDQIESRMKHHLRLHDTSRTGPFTCPKCPYQTGNHYHFKRHELTHKKDLFKCPECPFKTNNKGSLQGHISHHGRETGVKCMYCSYRGQYVLGHERLHQQKPKSVSPIQKCQHCPFTCNSTTALRRHMQYHSPSSKGTECGQCNYRSERPKSLASHRNLHGVRAYQCPDCDYKSWTMYDFKRHRGTHNDEEKQFQCVVCSYKCHRRDMLNSHLKRHQHGSSI